MRILQSSQNRTRAAVTPKQRCGNSLLRDSRFCRDHACLIRECPRERNEDGGLYCRYDTCRSDLCFNPVATLGSSRYCTDHECLATGCYQEASPAGVLCKEHTCLAKSCLRVCVPGLFGYCKRHEHKGLRSNDNFADAATWTGHGCSEGHNVHEFGYNELEDR
ncbi:hypothetical protein P171DRAFT_428409 [Karstenula rhodostoma CBS 690.94]|uniref:Uncharacterized protein n=1 Tax=Karstenula rhodostoma CBS 690.94 TaxID=1392251 RepID=A0A9P4UDY1_9PLEO|nr:hypothetical protein P171DRAFT_428409 [Karstenula rhodostoma CBS 690.94]